MSRQAEVRIRKKERRKERKKERKKEGIQCHVHLVSVEPSCCEKIRTDCEVLFMSVFPQYSS